MCYFLSLFIFHFGDLCLYFEQEFGLPKEDKSTMYNASMNF